MTDGDFSAVKPCVKSVLAGGVLVLLYSGITWLARGDFQWWHIDFIHGSNIYWGDNAYRYFLAKSAWLDSNVYWFNFVLPVAIFLDAMIVTLSNGSLFYAHALKSVPLVASLFFVYFSCLALGVRRCWSFLSVAILASTPLYVFVSLSFYGESWFVFFISLAMLLLAKERMLLGAFVIGLMPLVRIEGFNILAVFSLYALVRKDLLPLFIVFFPGTIYFLLVLWVGPGIVEFLSWRFETTKVYEGVGLWYGGDPLRVFDVLYWPWLLLAIYGLLMRAARPVIAVSAGVALIVLQLALTVMSETGSFEPRFLMAAFPVMAVGLALALSRMGVLLVNIKNASAAASSAVCILILFSNAYSVHIVKEVYQYASGSGRLPPAVVEQPYKMSTYFKKSDASKISGSREYADVTMRMIKENPNVKTLVVSDPNVLYFLDPEKLHGRVNVVFALFGWPTLEPVIEGDVTYGYFPKSPFSSYYALGFPESETELLLYLDDMKIEGYPYHWVVKGNSIYLFSALMLETAKIKAYKNH